MKALDDFTEDIVKNSATPAKHYLFEVRDDTMRLDKNKKDNFHSVVVLPLFVSQRCRLDIQTAVGFFTTRNSNPVEKSFTVFERNH